MGAHRRGWLRPSTWSGGARQGHFGAPFFMPEFRAERPSLTRMLAPRGVSSSRPGPRRAMERTMTKEMTGAEMVIEALADQGVQHIFGYPGGAVLPIYDALFHQANRVKHILVRHEQGAVHAAEGYARSTGKVGCVLVTSGPGATNAVTGLTDALMDSI